jgi:hypothetical protein
VGSSVIERLLVTGFTAFDLEPSEWQWLPAGELQVFIRKMAPVFRQKEEAKGTGQG